MSETNIEWGTPAWYLSNMQLELDIISILQSILTSGNMNAHDQSYVESLWLHLYIYLYCKEQLAKA